jgi:hypothetical protein
MQVTDQVRMKNNIHNIDTYGITKSVIRKHRNTKFKIRNISEYDDGSKALRFYGLGNNYELRMAFWNPDMFEVVN